MLADLVLAKMRPPTLVSILTALAVVAIDASAAAAAAAPKTLRHVVHEEIPAFQKRWSKAHRVYGLAQIPVRIGLTQQNLHRAEEFVHNVAHPGSATYGRHWTPHEVVDMFKPSRESVAAVMQWLQSEGIDSNRVRLSVSKTWLTFDATVFEMERLLKTEYHVYEHVAAEGAVHIACDKYHVPEHLVEHVDIITPTVHFDQRLGHDRSNNYKQMPENAMEELRKRSESKRRSLDKRQRPDTGIVGSPLDGTNPKKGADIENALMDLSQCDSMITPDCLRALYNMPAQSNSKKLSSKNSSLGIVEYTPQAFLQSDLDTYFSEFQPALRGKSPQIELLDNAVVQTTNQSFSFNGESALDLEYAMALIYPQQATLYQVGDLTQGASFNNFLDGIDGAYCDFEGGDSKDPNLDGQYDAAVNCGTVSSPPASVLSTSYGFNEADLSPRYERRQCDEYMKLALQGVTVVYSSGDFGVAGNGGACLDDNNNNTDSDSSSSSDDQQQVFNPSFPSGCPWVTSVGATQVRNGSTVGDAESACEQVIYSGGGFSNVFAMPEYQRDAVGTYLDRHVPDEYVQAGRFNSSGTVRAFPDVAVNGANYVTAVNGKFTLSYGTSGECFSFRVFLGMKSLTD